MAEETEQEREEREQRERERVAFEARYGDFAWGLPDGDGSEEDDAQDQDQGEVK